MPYSGRVAKGRAIAPRHTVFRNRTQALLHVAVLLEALEEVEEFNPLRLGNRPRPALWLDQPLYREDVKSLVAERRAAIRAPRSAPQRRRSAWPRLRP